MKKIIISLAIALLACAVAGAQQPAQKKGNHDWHQKIESEKIAYYTQAIGLTPEEAKLFWPVYDSIEKEQFALQKAERKAFFALQEALKTGKSEAEIDALLKDYLKAGDANVDLHAKNVAKYQAVLPAAKVAKFFMAKENFRRHMFSSLKAHGQPGHPQGGQPRKPEGK